MSTTQNETTLATIAARLAALEAENTSLRDKVAALEGRPTPQPTAIAEANVHRAASERRTARVGGRTTRRRMLQAALGVAAAAGVSAGAVLNREPDAASAHTGTEVWNVDRVNAHSFYGETHTDTIAVWGINSGANSGIVGRNNGAGAGVQGQNTRNNGVGVLGQGSLGVLGEGFFGVKGQSTVGNGNGVVGEHTGEGNGVIGVSSGQFHAGVLGRNAQGAGVKGVGANGVVGESSTQGYAATYGINTNENGGYGVVGDGKGASSAGVLGRNASGDGVRGEGAHGVHGKSSKTNYNAVWGQGTGEARGVAGTSTAGYGGFFQGGKAQLRLAPINILGKPTTGAHLIGELFLDKAATLWICTASGTPGTWKRVTVS